MYSHKDEEARKTREADERLAVAKSGALAAKSEFDTTPTDQAKEAIESAQRELTEAQNECERMKQSRESVTKLRNLLITKKGDSEKLVFDERIVWLTREDLRGPIQITNRNSRRKSRRKIHIHLAPDDHPEWSPNGLVTWDGLKDLPEKAKKTAKALKEVDTALNRLQTSNAAKAFVLGESVSPIFGRKAIPKILAKPIRFTAAVKQLNKIAEEAAGVLDELRSALVEGGQSPDLDRRLYNFAKYIRSATEKPHYQLIFEALRPYNVPHCESRDSLVQFMKREKKKRDSAQTTFVS